MTLNLNANNALLQRVIPANQLIKADRDGTVGAMMRLFTNRHSQDEGPYHLASLALYSWVPDLQATAALDDGLLGVVAHLHDYGHNIKTKNIVRIEVKCQMLDGLWWDYSKVGTGRSAFWVEGRRRMTNAKVLELIRFCRKHNLRIDDAVYNHWQATKLNRWSRNIMYSDAVAICHYAKLNNMPQRLWATI